MLQGEHSALLLTFIKLPSVIKIFILSIFEWMLKTGLLYCPYDVLLQENCCTDSKIIATNMLFKTLLLLSWKIISEIIKSKPTLAGWVKIGICTSCCNINHKFHANNREQHITF